MKKNAIGKCRASPKGHGCGFLLAKEEDVKTALDGSWLFQNDILRNHPLLFCFDWRVSNKFSLSDISLCAMLYALCHYSWGRVGYI